MGFFKVLGYVASGIGAVALMPATGGGSLALAIGAFGTTTAAGAVIGAGIGATLAAVDHASSANKQGYKEGHTQGKADGMKAGESLAKQKYEKKVHDLMERLQSYHNLNDKLVAMYAVGLAIANADGDICKEEREELDTFVAGCMAGHLPQHIKEKIASLTRQPPTLIRALAFAKEAQLAKRDIDDIIDLIANSDGILCPMEQEFIKHWNSMSAEYEAI